METVQISSVGYKYFQYLPFCFFVGSVIDDLTDFRYLVKDILSSGQSVIGDLTDFRYLVKDMLSSGQPWPSLECRNFQNLIH
jgi:hypothetical protein